jgi:parallel beta-helix repeat protein
MFKNNILLLTSKKEDEMNNKAKSVLTVLIITIVFLSILFAINFFVRATISPFAPTSPDNGIWTNDNTTEFIFTAISDTDGTLNCTLYLNDTIYGLNESVNNDTETTIISSQIPEGFDYIWYINCTDINGTLKSSSRILNVDLTAPTFSSNSTNSTYAGQSVEHNLKWQDDSLTGYIFSFDNGNGIFENDSWVSMIGTSNWSNVTKSVNSTIGSTIQWKVYANDSAGNWKVSEEYSYNTIDGTDPIASQGTNPINYYNSTSSSLTFDFKCSDNVNVSYIQLWGDWTGTWEADYSNSNYTNNLWLNITIDDIPQGKNYNWAVYCNDTAGLTNMTANRTFTVDAIKPIASQGTNPVDNYNDTDGSVVFDMKCSDNLAVDTIQLWGDWTGTWEADYSNSNYTNDTWLNITIDDILDGHHIWAVYCNDSIGNTNITTNRTFNSNYIVNSCGELNETNEVYTLTQNVSSNETCFDIIADNITLNCAHHEIKGFLNGSGIYSDGYNNITIENCLISNFTKGINLRSSSDNNIMHNMIYGNIDPTTAGGIEFYDVASSYITQNNISYNTWLGIYLDSSSNNVINNNTINFNNPEGYYEDWNGGIGDYLGVHNTIRYNTIQDNKYFGVWLAPAINDIISNNIISSFGSSGYEIYMDTSLANITNNILYGNSWGGIGVNSVDSNATVSGNKICGNNDGIEGGINDQKTGYVSNESGYINSTGYTLLEPTNARWIDLFYSDITILNASDGSDITSAKVINESGYINETGYTLAKSTLPEFALDSEDIEILNASDGEVISPENYTLEEDINVTTSYGTVENEPGYIDATGYILEKSYTYPLLTGLNVSIENITITNASNGEVISAGNYTLNETDTFDIGGSYGPESGYINETGYTLGISEFITDYYLGFIINITNITITNASDDIVISPGNYTFYLANYTLYNATNTTWDNVSITYDYEIDIPYYVIYNLTSTVWDNVNISYNYSYKTYTPDYIIYNLTSTIWDNVSISYNYTYMPYTLVYNISSSSNDYLASYTLYNSSPTVWDNVSISYYYDYYPEYFDGFTIENNTYCITLAPDAILDGQIIAAVDGYTMIEPYINFSYALSNRIAKNFSDAKCYLYIDNDITNNTVNFNNLPGELWIENYSLDMGDYTWYVKCNDSYGNGATTEPFIITTAESSDTSTFEVDTTAGSTTTLSREDTGTDVGLDINTVADETTDITINQYTEVPAGQSAFISDELGKYITITSGLTSMDWAIIKIYYTSNEVSAAGLDESTLRIQYYNTTSDTWTEYDTPNGGVNTISNYVWANVTHFSLFGAFGDKEGGHAGGGGGGTLQNETNVTNNQTQGNTVDLGDLIGSEEANIGTDDLIKFTLNDESHTLKILELSSSKVKLLITSSPIQVIINKDETKPVDLNADGTNDLEITFDGLVSGKADLVLKELIQQGEEITCAEGYERVGNQCIKKTVTKEFLMWPWIIVVVVLILLIMLLLIVFSRKRRRY